MVKWEYKWERPAEISPEYTNRLGEKGWDFAGTLGGDWVVFKRPLEPCKLEVDVLEEYDRAIEAVIDTRPCTCSACRERRETGYCPDADDEDAL